MNKVVCVRVGDRYAPEYTEKLYRGVKRNTTMPFEFECITESQYPGWWAKIELFPAKERIVYLDLDVIIVGNIDFLFEYQGEFCVMRDLIWKYNSSVMSIAPGFGKEIRERFTPAIMESEKGDQQYIETVIDHADYWPTEKVISYKWNYCQDGALGASIIAYHGFPKPQHLESDDWTLRHWI